jgi:hypothetical protein
MLVAMVIREVALVFMVPCMFVVMVLVLRVVVILIVIFFILVVIILLILVMELIIIIIIIFSGTLSKVSNPESKTTAWEEKKFFGKEKRNEQGRPLNVSISSLWTTALRRFLC